MLGFTYNMLQTAVVAVGGYVIGRNVVAVSASNREVALINEIVRNSRRSSVLEEAADAKLLGVVQERDILSLELDEIKQELHVALENEAALDVERGMLSLEVDIITVELHEALALPDMMKTDLMKAEENIKIAEEKIKIAEENIKIAEEKIKIAEENEAALDVEVKTLRAEVERLQQEAEDKKTKKSRWFS